MKNRSFHKLEVNKCFIKILGIQTWLSHLHVISEALFCSCVDLFCDSFGMNCSRDLFVSYISFWLVFYTFRRIIQVYAIFTWGWGRTRRSGCCNYNDKGCKPSCFSYNIYIITRSNSYPFCWYSTISSCIFHFTNSNSIPRSPRCVTFKNVRLNHLYCSFVYNFYWCHQEVYLMQYVSYPDLMN